LNSGSIGTHILNLKFEENKIGIFLTSSIGITLEVNFLETNSIGIASHSSRGVTIHDNKFYNNDLARVLFMGTYKSQIDANSISASHDGIHIYENSTYNKIINNTAIKNKVDINNADGLPITVNDNDYVNNKCSTSKPHSICEK